jgi:hypothetical protein
METTRGRMGFWTSLASGNRLFVVKSPAKMRVVLYMLLCFRGFLWGRTLPFPTPVVVPSIDAPVVLFDAAGPPALELPPAVVEGLCARANVPDRANAAARAIVVSFMAVSSVDDYD